MSYVLSDEVVQLDGSIGFFRMGASGFWGRAQMVHYGKSSCPQIQAHATKDPLLSGDIIQADELPFEETRPAPGATRRRCEVSHRTVLLIPPYLTRDDIFPDHPPSRMIKIEKGLPW